MKKLLLILPLYFVANLDAECQSCNAPRARRTSRYVNKQSYQEVRTSRKARPAAKAVPARVQKQQPEYEMIEIEQVVSEPAKPAMGMLPTPQAHAKMPTQKVLMADADIVRPKIHEGVNQTNYTASIGKSGALVHVVETKPVEANVSGKMIMPQVVDGQMQQKERPLSEQEAKMYHQKIKAAAAA